jgi:hypothetical protein
MTDADDQVGSAAEEAAKLLGAVSEWAREHGADVGTAFGGLAEQVSAAAHDVNTHLATGEDCRYCPLCRAVQVYRSASPEVREHLATAVTSLAQAATALLATAVPQQRGSGVERIDLTDEWPDDLDDPDDPEDTEDPE